jgi:sugar O-acyltransferase (sialic acid O-acetyltransferase NeuD family)
MARLAFHYFSTDSEDRVVAFCVDEAYHKTDEWMGLPVVTFEQCLDRFPPESYKMFAALGYGDMNRVRKEKYEASKQAGYRFASYVSTRSTILSSEPLGENCFILEDNTIQPFVQIGNNVVLWCSNVVGHDCVIEDHAYLAGRVSVVGHTRIGTCAFLGPAWVIGRAVHIRPRTLISSGALVMKNTVEDGVYIARPAVRGPGTSSEVDLRDPT